MSPDSLVLCYLLPQPEAMCEGTGKQREGTGHFPVGPTGQTTSCLSQFMPSVLEKPPD